ncbi:MAG TPA: hypothetical protein VKT30_19265 [Caulobacteraceae bacterium]|nr:hypothetical protein [Caulobacteraceae bacterium]
MLKKIVLATAVMASVAFSASAASAFVCYARSPVAYGWGSSGYLGTAKVIALRECAVRTPRGMVCVITGCT